MSCFKVPKKNAQNTLIAMVKRTLSQLKPGAPRRIHLLLAATLWSLIGSSLIIRGVFWLIAVNGRWVIIPAFIAGTLKSLFILDHSARKGVHRILELADGTCQGAVYSVKTWFLILFMMGSGMVLRHSTLRQWKNL